MRKVMKKLKRMLTELVRSQKGFSVLAIIFVMLVLAVVGYSFTRMIATKQKSVPVTAQSNRAFSMAESGINWSGKYLSELVSWSFASDQTKNLGNGSFDLSFTGFCNYGDPCPEGGTKMCITVASTGNYGDGQRVLNTRYCRDQGYGCTP
jgi:Tfp pilus assembly protein PilX